MMFYRYASLYDIAQLLLPIFVGVLLFCYPALPVRIAVGSRNYSLMKFMRG